MSASLAPGPGQQSTGIPEYFLKIIGDVESGKFDWTLQNNAAGVSLTLRLLPATPPPTRKRRRHFENSVNTDTFVSREKDHTKSLHVPSLKTTHLFAENQGGKVAVL
jgi:hypothetical protein